VVLVTLVISALLVMGWYRTRTTTETPPVSDEEQSEEETIASPENVPQDMMQTNPIFDSE